MTTNPAVALLIGLALLGAAVLLMAPRGGLLGWWRRSRESRTRVMIEDALKHLYDCEEKNLLSSLQSIAGALSVSLDRAARLAQRLQSMRLVHLSAASLTLTAEGRSYALRIIRVHRLWESYLADETALQEIEWHSEAEKKEHRLTQGEANALAARLGNPGFDPHGDPIPSPQGEIPRRPGMPLSAIPDGTVARIVHLEDEPPSVYAQLVAMGLYPGIHVKMISNSPAEVRIVVRGDERVLAPLFARNVTAAPVAPAEVSEKPHRTLDSLRQGEEAVVVGISGALRGQQRRRLMDFGIVPGTKINPELVSVGGDPTAYRVRGTLVALRKKQAELIFVDQGREAS
jgi:DtxR family transcriptional regulator, Mn-dependent transcriptional regulator